LSKVSHGTLQSGKTWRNIIQWHEQVEKMVMSSGQVQDYTRFRSFAERYLIERASTFTKGNQQREAHEEVLNARAMFRMIESVDRAQETEAMLNIATQQQNLLAKVYKAIPPTHLPSPYAQQAQEMINAGIPAKTVWEKLTGKI
jgi:phage terminase Nu1 subunit (DNA packaging protein)